MGDGGFGTETGNDINCICTVSNHEGGSITTWWGGVEVIRGTDLDLYKKKNRLFTYLISRIGIF